MEKWIDIPEYEGFYMVSTTGYIKSVASSKRYRKIKGKILSMPINTGGYFSVTLFKNGFNKRVQVHRIIALVFIPNPLNKKEVNHLNGIKTDNRIKNLEWCTPKENVQHAVRTGLKKVSQKQIDRLIQYNKTDHGVKITQFNKKGVFIRSFNSMSEATYITGLNYNSLVYSINRGFKCGGFVFKRNAV